MPYFNLINAFLWLCLVIFVISNTSRIRKLIKAANDRTDLLSRENARLYEENGELRERMKNMGFKDVDLDLKKPDSEEQK